LKWIKEHRKEYAGQWVALDGDRLGWMQQLKLGIVDYEGKLYIGSYDANTI
jgi:hypothetical protein